MRKTLLFFFSAVLLFAACSKEPVSDAEWVNISFTVETDAAATKTVGDASRIDDLTVLAYDKAGNHLDYIAFTCIYNGDGRFSARGRLVRGVEYTLLFFAAEQQVYDLHTDGTLTFSDFGQLNDGARDAFSAVKKVVGGESASLSVSLKRPFALLRVLSSQADQATAQAKGRTSGVKCQVVLDKVPNKMNLLTGAVEGSVQASFAQVSAYSAPELAFVFLPAGESKIYINGVVTVTADTFTSVRNIANIPLRRNCQTKLEGDFLTTEGSLDITLETN